MKLHLFYFNISKITGQRSCRFRLKVRGERLKARSFYRFALNYFYIVARGRGVQLIVNIFCHGVFSANYRRALNWWREHAGYSRVRGVLFSLWDYPNSIRDNEQRKATDPNKQSSKIALLRVSAIVLSLDYLIDN